VKQHMIYMPNSRSFTHQNGLSLIELMVSIAMGIALVLTILTFYQNFNSGSRTSQAEQKMNENAELAFGLLAQQMRQADYNPRQARAGVPTTNSMRIGTPPAGEAQMGVFGCANGFSNTTSADNIGSLTCNGTATTTITHAIAFQFEADQYSPSVSGAAPADCRGVAVPQLSQAFTAPTGTMAYYVVENRFFIGNGGLSCTGNGTTSSFAAPTQPLVDNVETLDIAYGVTMPNVTDTRTRYAAGYLGPAEIGPASGVDTTGVYATLSGSVPTLKASERWRLVKSVRVCMVLKSDRPTFSNVVETVGGASVFGYYYGCNPEDGLVNITDQYLRRSFVRHFALRNRIATPI
jgi:type IV pilus assembly protein PilW